MNSVTHRFFPFVTGWNCTAKKRRQNNKCLTSKQYVAYNDFVCDVSNFFFITAHVSSCILMSSRLQFKIRLQPSDIFKQWLNHVDKMEVPDRLLFYVLFQLRHMYMQVEQVFFFFQVLNTVFLSFNMSVMYRQCPFAWCSQAPFSLRFCLAWNVIISRLDWPRCFRMIARLAVFCLFDTDIFSSGIAFAVQALHITFCGLTLPIRTPVCVHSENRWRAPRSHSMYERRLCTSCWFVTRSGHSI